ncbi:tetratricopeptide repeat protein [Desulfonema magnum]|uniref:Tetratricopeptide repeat-containing protein n=1 Tax=Desulfonema magnum TaxID=45655 RepID=A0A975BER8_9BACT|nr:hypothetical protein [Desulfonema magnum]QTA84021.1 Tetratricopeptide repeat-containing protein [Desulfonema magnum]
MTNHEELSEIKLHVGIAEQGKVYALAEDYPKALLYYRQAMHMTVQAQDPEIFFRHYLECIMECLEQMGSFAEVLEYCEKAIQYYKDNAPPSTMEQWNFAHVYQRKGAVCLKTGDTEVAGEAFKKALEIAGEIGEITSRTMPLTQTLLRWISSGLHIDPQRVTAEQKRTQYFSVRQETVDPKRAVRLPDESKFI